MPRRSGKTLQVGQTQVKRNPFKWHVGWRLLTNHQAMCNSHWQEKTEGLGLSHALAVFVVICSSGKPQTGSKVGANTGETGNYTGLV